MQAQTFSEAASLDNDNAANDTKRPWWKSFGNVGSHLRIGGGRRRLIEEIREEQRQLVVALEKISDRLESDTTTPFANDHAMSLDPMPVMRTMESLIAGQKDISAGFARQIERAGEAEQRVSQAVNRVDQSLQSVRMCQAETVTTVGQVGDKMEDIAGRFEALFSKMSDAEERIAQDYRKLQNRTLMAVGGIGFSVIAALAVFLATAGG